MHLTPDILEAAYDYLRVTSPFKRWKLPPGDEVGFKVIGGTKTEGTCDFLSDGHYCIRVSSDLINRTSSLMSVMAHEMVHLYCHKRGVKAHHGRDFMKAALSVCKHHGFDPLLF